MKSTFQFLCIIIPLEDVSFLVVLFITMPLKYFWAMRELNMLVDMTHGVLFILYCLFVIVVARQYKWSLKTIFWASLTSIVPFETFVIDRKIFAKEK